MHRAGAARVRTHGAAAQSDGRTAATLGSRKKAGGGGGGRAGGFLFTPSGRGPRAPPPYAQLANWRDALPVAIGEAT
ncbi:hypothetical protein GSH05_33745, partial [Burkholderia pseudomallei]|uniref:hypothetical protein n=1 Tax=Burkholderia pseudomallei TaxID=28450 RepID=UPI0019402B71